MTAVKKYSHYEATEYTNSGSLASKPMPANDDYEIPSSSGALSSQRHWSYFIYTLTALICGVLLVLAMTTQFEVRKINHAIEQIEARNEQQISQIKHYQSLMVDQYNYEAIKASAESEGMSISSERVKELDYENR